MSTCSSATSRRYSASCPGGAPATWRGTWRELACYTVPRCRPPTYPSIYLSIYLSIPSHLEARGADHLLHAHHRDELLSLVEAGGLREAGGGLREADLLHPAQFRDAWPRGGGHTEERSS
eukprot:scaffold37147_cov53-Phaeocystis_antarctica.AAC.2